VYDHYVPGLRRAYLRSVELPSILFHLFPAENSQRSVSRTSLVFLHPPFGKPANCFGMTSRLSERTYQKQKIIQLRYADLA